MYWNAMVDTITRTGHEVTVHVNPESREYNGRWYTELRAWKTEQGSGGELPKGSRLSQDAENDRQYSGVPPSDSSDIGSDDLPF